MQKTAYEMRISDCSSDVCSSDLANYAFQGDGSKYIASIKLWKLGSAMLRHATLRSMAEAEMQSLMEQTGESVHLSVLEEMEIVYLHKIDSDNPVDRKSVV